ncbi:MAG: response regulator transcription factor [Acidobacteriota bacterium]
MPPARKRKTGRRRTGSGTVSGTILVADDSPNIREIVQMSLESTGYSVVLAEDGERTLRRMESDRPDLMIVDVMMPRVNGFQICRRVKSNPKTEKIPVILLTARSQEEDVFWGKDCGADEYITKPFSTRELERTVQRLMRRRADRMKGRGSGVRGEIQRRREEGLSGRIVALEWDRRSMDIFRKKYGEVKFSAALKSLREEAEGFLEDRREPGPVDVREAFGLYVVIGGDEARAAGLGEELAGRLSSLAATFYGDEDRARGFIPFRDPRTGHEERLSLLGFRARIEAETAT